VEYEVIPADFKFLNSTTEEGRNMSTFVSIRPSKRSVHHLKSRRGMDPGKWPVGTQSTVCSLPSALNYMVTILKTDFIDKKFLYLHITSFLSLQ
jgi:hypothetical protein